MKREEVSGISKELDSGIKQEETSLEDVKKKQIEKQPEMKLEYKPEIELGTKPVQKEPRSGQVWRQTPEEDFQDELFWEDFEEAGGYEEKADGAAEGQHGHNWDEKGRQKWFHSISRGKSGRRHSQAMGLLHPSDGLLAAFFIPIIIMVVIFAQRGIFPFGQESFLRTDMYHQYAPFFSEFQYKLSHGNSLFYSWDIGMGINFAALYAYYLASPLNWLLILCPKEYIIEFMTYSIVLKIGLCGLTFAYYLKRHNRSSDFGVGFFGIFYALSGYLAAYSWNIMWMDCILLFPLIMLGLERLVKEKKGALYCITLGISILSNYYISIMICIFMALYFICLWIMEDRRRVKDVIISFFQFAGYSLIAGGLAAVVLLPEIAALQSTASGDFSFPKNFEMYFPIFDMLARHIGNVETETGLNHWPNIYCGVAVYLFFLLYLSCRRIPVKEKAVTLGLLLLFFASFSINILNFVWHGLHYPNSLPCRQSFIYIFLMLSLCYRAYMYINEIPKKHVAIAFFGSISYILLAQKLIDDKAYHDSVFYVAILFLSAYAGMIYFYKNPGRTKGAAVLLALSLVSVEAAINTTVTSISTTSRTAYKEDNKEISELTEGLAGEEISFYRIDKTFRKTKNDGAWMNYPSVSLFSSLANADMTDFFKKMGCEGSTNAYSITGGTPLIDSLFSIKYGMYREAQDNPRLSLRGHRGSTYLYENPYTLPLGFMLPEKMETDWKLDMNNPIDVQNDLSNVLNLPYSLTEVLSDETGGRFSFTAEHSGEYYVNVLNKKVKSVTVTKGETSKSYDNLNRGYLLEIGYCTKGEQIIVENKEDSEIMNARAYLVEEEGLKAIYETLSSQPFHVIKWEDDYLEGTVDTREAGSLFLSIPYDKGWGVTVDGTPVTTKKVLNAFIGIELEPGRHTIILRYAPAGLKMGAAISGASILILILAIGCSMRKRKRIPNPYDRLDEEWYGGTG